ncbi:4006_t:CDS:2 [Funneliformis caledonium]|uniref:4006_t:CDS:1 n=1 Tax=Funneliformis caledonium TaxID=1117310 RepID=A0A9N9AFQ7_9GLOM|nr:4006_t:CDS:2 [Funneliformis caledonium]
MHLSQQEFKAFVQENSENRRLSSKKLVTVWTAHTKQSISAITMCQNLKKVGLTSCIPRKKPTMTEVHCQAHL